MVGGEIPPPIPKRKEMMPEKNGGGSGMIVAGNSKSKLPAVGKRTPPAIQNPRSGENFSKIYKNPRNSFKTLVSGNFLYRF